MQQAGRAAVAIEYPLGPHDRRCLLLRQFLAPAECAALLQAAEQRGFSSAEANYPPSYRNNQRLVFSDPQLAQTLLPRLRGVLPEVDDGWLLDAINPRWRSCRYAPGQAFNLHQDGVFHAADGRLSRLTFMLYLNDAREFSGGDTVFYDGPPDRLEPPRELARVRPSAGALIVFEHALWHAGAQVTAGSKTILRSDLLYRRIQPEADSGHRGYVFCLAALDDAQVLSGGRDGTIRLSRGGQDAVIVARHTQSVLGLHVCSGGRFAAVSRDCCLALHDLIGAAAWVNPTAHDGAVLCVTGIGERLWTGGADHQIGVWDLHGASLGRLHGHRGWVWDLAVVDLAHLLSVGEDRRVLYWHDGVVKDELTLEQPLRAVVCSADGTQVVVGDAAGDLHLLALVDGRLQNGRRLPAAHRAQIRKLRTSADGRLLSCAEDGQIVRWDRQLRRSEALLQREGFATDALLCGDTLVSAGYAGGVLRHSLQFAA